MGLKFAVEKLCGVMGGGAPSNGMCGVISKLTAHVTMNIATTGLNQHDYAMQLYIIRDFVVTL